MYPWINLTHVTLWTPPVERGSHGCTCRLQQSLPNHTAWRHVVDTLLLFFCSCPCPIFLLSLTLAALTYPENKHFFHFSVWWWCMMLRSCTKLLCLSGRGSSVDSCWLGEHCFNICVVFCCMLLIFENVLTHLNWGKPQTDWWRRPIFSCRRKGLKIGLLEAHCWYPLHHFLPL